MLDFPRAKQLFYASTARLWLAGPDAAAAAGLAQDAVTIYEQALRISATWAS